MPPLKPVVGYAIRSARIRAYRSFTLLLPDPATNLPAPYIDLAGAKKKGQRDDGVVYSDGKMLPPRFGLVLGRAQFTHGPGTVHRYALD